MHRRPVIINNGGSETFDGIRAARKAEPTPRPLQPSPEPPQPTQKRIGRDGKFRYVPVDLSPAQKAAKTHPHTPPSLYILATGEKILIHCFVGCDSEDVLTAVGLTWKDLYPDPWQCAAQRPNEAAQKYVRRTLASLDPRTIETAILRIAAHRLRAGERLSVEEQARVEVAWERLDAWDQEDES